MQMRIKSKRIITPDGIVPGYVYINDGIISAVTEENMPYDDEYDAGDKFVSPGFIDLHVHGGAGFDFCSTDVDGDAAAMNYHLAHGTTAMLPTVTSVDFASICRSLENIRACTADGKSRIGMCGVHLEGPYFSAKQAGAQNPENITPPKKEQYTAIVDRYGDIIKRWSFAPELLGSEEFCRYICANGIMPSIGHSDAVYEDCMRAYDNGCRMVTHLYSAMSTITREYGYRRLGVIETAYLLDDMDVEIISDGCHLPPELIRLVVKLKGTDRVCLVTDCMSASGTNLKESEIGGTKCIIEDGVAKIPDRSGFAGSIATADRLVRTCVKLAGIQITDAVKMMSDTPARVLGAKKGRLEKGFDADIVIFDDDINIETVFVKGERVK